MLTVSVLPWPTALLAEYTRDGTAGDQRLAVLIYGLTSTAMSFTFNALWRYLLRHKELHKPHVTAAMLEVRNRRYNLGLAAYPVATAIGLLSVPVFLALMLALAIVYLLPTPDVEMTENGGSAILTLRPACHHRGTTRGNRGTFHGVSTGCRALGRGRSSAGIGGLRYGAGGAVSGRYRPPAATSPSPKARPQLP